MAKTEFTVGELIENRYRILSMVSLDRMNILYRVSDEAREGEIVALKTVRLSAAAAGLPDRVERFRREFQVLTQLRHPNLVSVYNYGITARGELYFTMEWVEGQNLEPGLRALEPADTIPVTVQVCRALAYLHARGVIHGNLKPSNVLMAGEQVRLVDFGVAQEMGSSEVQAQYFTPGYTAAEVEQPRPIDHRADLYSLGALWYALLAGEPPMFMPGPGRDRLMRFSLEEALEGQRQVPTKISAVITRLLAESPGDRYGSANEVIVAINRVTGRAYQLETRETAGSYALRGRFVGRAPEMEMLQEAWSQSLSGEGKLMLVGGESGVGKTRLLEEFVVQAELEGARVARGQCVESGGIAYRPWREVLRVLMRYVEGSGRVDLERMGPVLATLLPELWGRDYMVGLAPPAELEPRAAQGRLNYAVVEVLRAAAGLRPTVVVLEDAHWADEATLALLSFLTPIAGRVGVLVCVTYRSDEVGSDHPLATLAGNRVQRIPLQTLPPQVTMDLVRSMLGHRPVGADAPTGREELPASLVERVQQTTEGNAFFVQELIRSLAEDGVVLQRTVEGWRVDRAALQKARLPESIRQVVWRRLAHLSAKTQQVLRQAAIVGPVFWDGVVEEISQTPREQMQAALAEGLEQEMILERGASAFEGEREFLFIKSTVQEVSYESTLREERQDVHGRVAAWLIARSDEQDGEHLGLIADHLEAAGQTERAARYLHQAGKQAAAQFANTEAIAYLSRAFDLTLEDATPKGIAERYDILLAREKVYNLEGARESQVQDLGALRELAQELDDDRRQAEVALRRSYYTWAISDYPAAIAAAQAAIRLAQTAQDVSIEADGYLQWGQASWRLGDFEACRVQLEQALALARAAGSSQLEADSLRILGNVYYYLGDYAEAPTYWEQALPISREIGDRPGEASALGNLGEAARSQGNYAQARDYYEQRLRICSEIGERYGECIALVNIGLVSHNLGDDQAALEHSQQTWQLVKKIGSRTHQGYALTVMGHALVGLGRLAEAADAYRRAVTLRQELGEYHLTTESWAGLARVSLAQDDLVQAQVHVEEILSYLDQGNTLEGTEEPLRVYATCYRVLYANLDPRAEAILSTAHRLLQEQAAKITSEEMRRSFLENVAAHREIIAAWESG